MNKTKPPFRIVLPPHWTPELHDLIVETDRARAAGELEDWEEKMIYGDPDSEQTFNVTPKQNP